MLSVTFNGVISEVGERLASLQTGKLCHIEHFISHVMLHDNRIQAQDDQKCQSSVQAAGVRMHAHTHMLDTYFVPLHGGCQLSKLAIYGYYHTPTAH